MTHIFVFKLHPLCCSIGIGSRFFEIFSLCCHTEHTPAVCHNLSVLKLCAGMETVIPFMLVKFFQPLNRETFFITYRISFGCQYHAYCCIVFKLQIYLIQCSVNTCFHNFNQIILHTRQYNLRFRIPEACIVFQYLRSLFCQHQSKKDHAFKLSTLCCHSIHRCLINVFATKFFHFFCVERAW